ncbi:RidA family protein [Gottschalkiaceae bacterium SANA]|jgi:2-iminobutanoate/2-iminopropanoate deaminase|nr:RidA family protein [Gottschalkiaceae bacterium SANA]
MAKKIIATTNAPGAIGPYSQAVQIGNLVYTSGQLGMTTAAEMPATIEEQTKLSLENVKAILAEAGTDMSKVIKTLVFIKDMNDFGAMNGVYQQYFTENFPARSCVEVARLPKDALVEIEVIAEV